MASTKSEAEADTMCCASCGIAEVDDTKLNKCTACDLVRYCGDECQRKHSPQHEQACKKRAAEIYDEILFKQPESSHLGDCPICVLPIPLDKDQSSSYSCCSKIICKGCSCFSQIREMEQSLDPTCPFCRLHLPKTMAEAIKDAMKRAKANDPLALRRMAEIRYKEGDYGSAFEYWTKAAELGEAEANYHLSCSYEMGKHVQKDMKKAVYHAEQAAIGGHPAARHNLGRHEESVGRIKRAGKHYIIAANLGFDGSLVPLRECYAMGVVQKEDFAAALRAHQAAVNATRSPQREAEAAAAAEYYQHVNSM